MTERPRATWSANESCCAADSGHRPAVLVDEQQLGTPAKPARRAEPAPADSFNGHRGKLQPGGRETVSKHDHVDAPQEALGLGLK